MFNICNFFKKMVTKYSQLFMKKDDIYIFIHNFNYSNININIQISNIIDNNCGNNQQKLYRLYLLLFKIYKMFYSY